MNGYDIIQPFTNFSHSIDYQEKYSKFTREDCINDEWQKLFHNTCGCFSPLLSLSRTIIDYAKHNKTSMVWCTDSHLLIEFAKIKNIKHLKNTKTLRRGDKIKYENEFGELKNIVDDMNGTASLKMMQCLLESANQKKNIEIINGLCPAFCFQESFQTETNFFDWRTTKQDWLKYLYKIQRKFLYCDAKELSYVHIIYDSSKKTQISEFQTYPLINLCSNIGGILGLWTGISVLVSAEFVVILKAIFSTCRHERQDSPKK